MTWDSNPKRRSHRRRPRPSFPREPTRNRRHPPASRRPTHCGRNPRLARRADGPNLVRDAGLAHVGGHWEFVPQLPDDRRGDEPGRIHQPEARLLRASVDFRGGEGFWFGLAGHGEALPDFGVEVWVVFYPP